MGTGGPNVSFAFLTDYYMRDLRRNGGRILARCAWRSGKTPWPIPHALFKVPLTLDQYMNARPIADPIHLFDCVMPCAGAEAYSGDAGGTGQATWVFKYGQHPGNDRTAQRLYRRSQFNIAVAGRLIATICMAWRA